MSLTLTVDGDRWRRLLREVLAAHPRIVPVAKVQSVRLSRNFLQRRLGLATLSIDTAGAPMVNAPRIIDLREDKARALATQLTAAQLSGRKSGTDR